MKKLMDPPLILLLWFMVFFGCAPHPIDVQETIFVDYNKPPVWYPQPPTSEIYYQGIGVASFNEDMQTTIEMATQNAMFDLTRSIEVSIKGTLVDSAWEGMGISEEFIRQVVETSVNQQNIPEIEVVDRWVKPPLNEAYVYVRLKKESYEQYKQKNYDTALKYTLQYLSDGDYQLQKNKFSVALQYFLTAFYYSRFLLGQTNDVEYPEFSGSYIDINMLVFDRIQSLLSNISVKEKNVPKYIKAYSSVFSPIEIEVDVKISGYQSKPLRRFPILFKAEDQGLELDRVVLTDKYGVVKNMVRVSHPQEVKAGVQIQLALDSVYIEKENLRVDLPVLYDRVFVVPFLKVNIPIVPTFVYLEGRETINGLSVEESEKFVTRALQEALVSARGISFVEKKSEADYSIAFNASCKFQTIENQLYVFIAYISVDIFRGDGDEKIFSNIYEPVEGFGNYMRQGGIMTLEKAGVLMRDQYAKSIVRAIAGES